MLYWMWSFDFVDLVELMGDIILILEIVSMEMNRFGYFEGFSEEYEIVGWTRNFVVWRSRVFQSWFYIKRYFFKKEKSHDNNKKNEIEIIPLKYINNLNNVRGEYFAGRIIKKGNEITLSLVIKSINLYSLFLINIFKLSWCFFILFN